MARGHENLTPFDKRSEEEQRKIRSAGGKASGEARRRKADFRKTLNLLLTAEIDSPEWTPLLKSLGLESTLETALNMAMIKEGLSGNVKAYEAIARFSGQSEKTDADLEEQRVRTAAAKVKSGQDDAEEAEDDGFMESIKQSAASDWEDLGGGVKGEEEGDIPV